MTTVDEPEPEFRKVGQGRPDYEPERNAEEPTGEGESDDAEHDTAEDDESN